MVGGQGLRGLHEAGARSAQSEPSALIGHPLLQARDLGVQRLGNLGGLGRAVILPWCSTICVALALSAAW